MSFTESSAVIKSNVDPDAKVSSETSLSQKTFKEDMSRGTEDTNLASDTEAENTAKEKPSEYSSGFSATDVDRERLSRRRKHKGDTESEVSEKEDVKCESFERFRAVPKHDEFKWDEVGSPRKFG